jgi:hypothetical protein
MLSKQYIIIPLRILFIVSATLLWHTVPRAEAKEAKVTTEAPVCKKEQVVDNEYLKPSAKTMQEISKSHLQNKGGESSGQNAELCQTPETDEVPETAEINSDETVETPDNSGVSSDEDMVEPSNPIDPSNNEWSIPNDPTLTQPSVSEQDSHDLNFSIQMNTGGGTSSDSGENFPEPDISSPNESEASPPIPEKPVPATEGSVEQPTKPHRPHLKPQQAKPHHPKKHKEKQHKVKKPHKNDKDSKHDYPKRPNHKTNKHSLKKSNLINKPVKKIEGDHRNPIKHHQNSKVHDKSYRDRLPLIRRQPNAHKLRPLIRQNVKTHRRVFSSPAPRLHRSHKRVR